MSFSLKSGLWSLTDLFSKSLSLETCLIQLLMKLVWEFLTMLVLTNDLSCHSPWSLVSGLWQTCSPTLYPLDVSSPVRLYCWSWGKHPLWYCCQTNSWCGSCEGPGCLQFVDSSSWPGTLYFSNPWFGGLAYLVSELSLNSSAQLLARLMSRVTPSLIVELMLSQSALLPMLWLSAGLSMQSSSMLLPTLMTLAASLATSRSIRGLLALLMMALDGLTDTNP